MRIASGLLSLIFVLNFCVAASGQQNPLAKQGLTIADAPGVFASPDPPGGDYGIPPLSSRAPQWRVPRDGADHWTALLAANITPVLEASDDKPMQCSPAVNPNCGHDLLPDGQPAVSSTSTNSPHRGIHWWRMVGEEMLYIGFKHTERIVYEEKTRRELGGPYFADWGYILNHLNLDRWSDGGRWTTNNLYHSADGAIYGFIYKRNDDNARYLEIDLKNPAYRKSLLKAWVISAVASAEFEIGPVSEATIGHVGLHKDWTGGNGTGWTDFIVTPCGGTALMMGEDAIDKYLTARWEQHLRSRVWINLARIVSNPSRSLANVFTLTKPWHRDTRDEDGRPIARAE